MGVFPNVATQFKPGNDGGKGRTKQIKVSELLRDLLTLNTIAGSPLPEGKTAADLIAETILKHALTEKGGRYLRLLLAYTEGKPIQPVELSGRDGEAIQLSIVEALEKVYGPGTGSDPPVSE
jgi:hypothetical protein